MDFKDSLIKRLMLNIATLELLPWLFSLHQPSLCSLPIEKQEVLMFFHIGINVLLAQLYRKAVFIYCTQRCGLKIHHAKNTCFNLH
jgi:hypothetical protein